jgi:hypothetical protein
MSRERTPSGALAVRRAEPALTTFQGKAAVVGEPLRAPASGLPCAHWRLRIVEFLAPGMELVHEVSSPHPLEIVRDEPARAAPDLDDDDGAGAGHRAFAPPAPPAARIRLAPESARIHAVPTLFREGTPGALAVAREFGLRGRVRVEEVLIRQGEALSAEGVLTDPAGALSHGPFRTIDAPLELLAATLRLENGLSLRPIILPWVLGAAAAMLGTLGAATALLHWWDGKVKRSVPNVPTEIGVKKIVRPLWP